MVRTDQGWRYGPTTGYDENASLVVPRDRVRWGPIVAGLLSALTTFIILSLLGAAIGATTLAVNNGNPNQGHYSAAAGIWGAVSALIAFFIGGFIAAKTAAVGGNANAWLNGAMVFVGGLTAILLLSSAGLGNLFGALGVNLNDIRNLAVGTFNTTSPATGAVDNAAGGLWWSLLAIVVGLVAAAIGGLAGHRDLPSVRHTDEAVTG